MNKKITIQNNAGKLAYCILSGEQNLEDQFNQFYYGSPNPQHGTCVRFDGAEVAVVDYYHNETIASLKVVSIQDTDQTPVYAWISLENKSCN